MTALRRIAVRRPAAYQPAARRPTTTAATSWQAAAARSTARPAPSCRSAASPAPLDRAKVDYDRLSRQLLPRRSRTSADSTAAARRAGSAAGRCAGRRPGGQERRPGAQPPSHRRVGSAGRADPRRVSAAAQRRAHRAGHRRLQPPARRRRSRRRYGMRMHPILHYVKLHTGTDFAGGDGFVHAADDGRVLFTVVSIAYGNFTVIDHGMIDGTAHHDGLRPPGPLPGQGRATWSRRASRSASSAPPATPPARTCTSRSATTAPSRTRCPGSPVLDHVGSRSLRRRCTPASRQVHQPSQAERPGQVDAWTAASEQRQPECDPVGHEQRDGVAGDEPQQPGDRGVGDDEGHAGADDERADGHVSLTRVLELEQAGADQRRDGQEERQPGRRDPVVARAAGRR